MYHVHVYLYIYIYFFFLSRDLLHLHLLLRDSRHYTHAHSSDIHRVNVALTTAEASTVAHPASFLHPRRVLHLILSSLGSSVATVRNYPSSTSGYTPVTRPAVLRQCCSLTMHQAKDTATRSSRPIRARSSLNCAHGDETPFPHRAVDLCPCVMWYAVYVCVDRVHLTVLMAFCGRRFKSGFSSSSSSPALLLPPLRPLSKMVLSSETIFSRFFFPFHCESLSSGEANQSSFLSRSFLWWKTRENLVYNQLSAKA